MGKGKLRNEPCYCGSGLKYKKCCLESKEKEHVHLPNPEGICLICNQKIR